MKRRILIGRTLVLVLLVGCALYQSRTLDSPAQTNPEPRTINAVTPPKSEEVSQAVASYGLPVRLKIPKLNVDAPINSVGLTPEGDMQAPSEAHEVGWYKLGPRPGETGSAVMAGHYGRSRSGEKSVFDVLHTLQEGELIYVEDEAGAIAAFVVRKLQSYGQNQTVPDVFGSSDGKAHLNLITCQGVWDKTRRTYSDRLVVFAAKVTE